jgi:glyceraldehyde-3-phosphate dehydrogenase (NAD(P))
MGGMVNTVVPETRVPSHQGPDARTVIADLPITTVAAAGPFNLSHLHFAMVETTRPVDVDELRAVLLAAPRVAFVRASEGLSAPNAVIELMRDLGRPRADMWEVAVWEDALAAQDGELHLTYQVHNEAIVVPETIDRVRALTELERDPTTSSEKTDRALGVRKVFLPRSAGSRPARPGGAPGCSA